MVMSLGVPIFRVTMVTKNLKEKYFNDENTASGILILNSCHAE